MTTYYIWRYTCTTEGATVREILKSTDPAPTSCHNDRVSHTIDLTSVTKEKELTERIVTIKEESVPTGGKWKGKAICLHGVSGPDVETTVDYTWDWPISVLDLQVRPLENNEGDYIKLEVLPPDNGFGEGVIGALSATAPTGATGITVPQSIIDILTVSDHISLKEGAKEEDLGPVISIDNINNIVYFKNPTATQFSATPPTFVKMKRYVIDDFILGPADRYPLGDSKIGGSYVPAGNIVRATYVNKTAEQKKLYAIIEYLE